MFLLSLYGSTTINNMISIWSKHIWSYQFLRFLIVGAANTLVGYVLYLIGLWIGIPYQAALSCATVLGAIFNFFTTGRLVFESRALNRIFGFLAVYGITFAVNLALLTWLVQAGMAKAYAQAILLPIVVLLSFLLNKHLVFGRVT
ncbi:MAG: GtrA family protein [Methylovirgula sp.]